MRVKQDQLIVTGGRSLKGSVAVAGAKNAALPILAASMLAQSPVTLSHVPHLDDVTTMLEMLGRMGVSLTVDEQRRVIIDPSALQALTPPSELMRRMRASFLMLGPLLARYGKAHVCLPGGCDIGQRPVDVHLAGLRQLGAEIEVAEGHIHARVPKKHLAGRHIVLDKVSVTGTENVLMAAVLAEGETQIENAALEPEVEDLAYFLNAMGARVSGAGTPVMRIEGVPALHGCEYTVLPDRIEAGTYLAAAAVTGGQVQVNGIKPALLSTVLDVFRAAGADIRCGDDWIALDGRARRLQAVDFTTAPYPGIPTDMQAQFMVMNAVAEGRSRMTESIFENRFQHAHELMRMGADLTIDQNTVICQGVSKLQGARIKASDLRASASLVLAGLVAEGETVIEAISHIDRGYEWIEEKLARLGAQIRRAPGIVHQAA